MIERRRVDGPPSARRRRPPSATAQAVRSGRNQSLRGAARGGWSAALALLALLALASTAQARPGDPSHVPIPGGLQGKACYECHIRGGGVSLPSQERPRRYSLAGAFETYLESPHGRLRRLGDLRAPMCEDCHFTREWKDILPREHPDSPIHPRNLGAVCARCHGPAMRTANVAEGSMHLELRHRSLVPGAPLDVKYGFLPGLTKSERAYFIGPFDVTAYVSGFFLLITVGTLVVFGLYMVVDLYRKLKERSAAARDASHHDS